MAVKQRKELTLPEFPVHNLYHSGLSGQNAFFEDTYNPECTLDYVHHRMLFEAFQNYAEWCDKIKIRNAADLNEVVSSGKYNELIRLCETYYNNQLSNIAETIYQNKNTVKLVLIAGTSSAGKTTTSKKLET